MGDIVGVPEWVEREREGGGERGECYFRMENVGLLLGFRVLFCSRLKNGKIKENLLVD